MNKKPEFVENSGFFIGDELAAIQNCEMLKSAFLADW
jgi:hypothetical protein